MADAPLQGGGAAERLRVFVSSTIVECARERDAARRAIVGLNFEPALFEREGARAEAPREFYLRKLQDSHVVVAVYREAYGWIDAAKGMAISGIEDEFREALRLGRAILAYVLRSPPKRDPRLSAILDELMGGPNVVYFFDDGEDLEGRIRDDLTALISDRLTRAQPVARVSSAEDTLSAIFREDALRVRRTALLQVLSDAASSARVVWVTGESGAGKTALAAEWAADRRCTYVSARGMDARTVLLACAQALGVALGAELATPLFDEARSLLQSRWRNGAGWPLVLDDPGDLDVVWPVLSACLAMSATGSIVVVTREAPAWSRGEEVRVPGFSTAEIQMLSRLAGSLSPPASAGDLPIALREAARVEDVDRLVGSLDAVSRELLGYVALSPATLQLEDLSSLLGQSAGAPTELSERAARLSSLLVEGQAGYDFVHERQAEAVAGVLAGRPQLRSLLVQRLSAHLDRTGRSWAAFRLRKAEDSDAVERLANRAVAEAAFSGSTSHLVEALSYLVDRYRRRSEPGRLISVLVSLAEARVSQGRALEAPALLAEALAIAQRIGDDDAQRMIDLLTSSIDLRRTLSPAALDRVRELRRSAERDGRPDVEGRLLIDEGVAYLGFNEAPAATPLFRRARELFVDLGDRYGLEIATRNLIVSLSAADDGLAEAERLRAELEGSAADTPRHQAWLRNLLVPRLRREGRLAEAEAMAREAIAIGTDLGDLQLTAINQIVLGNVLRDAGDLEGARSAYMEGGRLAQAVGRPDIEGRSSRLLASTDNQEAEQSSGAERRDCAIRAEQYARHAAALLAESFAWGEHAFALEERGDALRLQGREAEAMVDYADAVRGYLRAGDEAEVERLAGWFIRRVRDRRDGVRLVARAFGGPDEHASTSQAWMHAVGAVLAECPRKLAPSVLGQLVRSYRPDASAGWWMDSLLRCLLLLDRSPERSRRTGLGPMLLLALLGYCPHRELGTRDLLILAGLCFDRSEGLAIRHRPGGDLGLVIHLGASRRMLFTVRCDPAQPEALFATLLVGSFIAGFSEDLSEILSPDVLPQGAALDVTVLARADAPEPVPEALDLALGERAVATARLVRQHEDEEVPIVMVVRPGAIGSLIADPERFGECEYMLAGLLDEIIHVTTGRSADEEIFSSKLKELLVAVFR